VASKPLERRAVIRPAWKPYIRRSVVVNLKDNTAFRGILWDQRGPLLILRRATMHEHGQATPVDGEVVLERSAIQFLQILPSPEVP
jgi:hypothetical protein